MVALPSWYFETILNPLAVGPLTAIPAFGAMCLGIGVILALIGRERRLLLFLVPLAISEILVALAGALRGDVPESAGGPILLVFVIAQSLFSIYLVYRMKGARWAASALALFSLTYALFAAFIAAMAFTDSWL